MTSITKHSNRVRAAKAFLNDIDVSATKIYMGLSGTTAWGDEQVPDTPLNTINESESFWNELFGVARIATEDTMAVIPRRDWTVGDGYAEFDTAHTDAFKLPFYALATNNYVYECKGIPANNIRHAYTVTVYTGGSGYDVDDVLTLDGGTYTDQTELTVVSVDTSGGITALSISTVGDYTVVPIGNVSVTGGAGSNASFEMSWVGDAVSSEPTHTTGTITVADGYTWTALYTIGSYLTLLTANWLPVEDNYDTQVILGSNQIILRRHIPDATATGNKIPSNIYRKIGILIDPLKTNDLVLDVLYGDATDYDPDYAEQNRGVVLMLDHRSPIARQEGQTETIYVIVEF